MPVPSTMMVLSDTSVGMLYFWVSRQQNFIMIAGPMANARSTCSALINFSIPTVTTPFSPYEPSSVMIITSSELSLTSFSRMIRSLERPARTESTRFPAAFSARIIGSIGATPTPPPAQTTVPKFSMCVGLPSGPTTSVTYSPSLRLHNLIDERPTFCTTSVIVPFVVSASAIVSGILSPLLPTLTITKFPAFLLLAISGASMSKRYTFSENCTFLIILFMALQIDVDCLC